MNMKNAKAEKQISNVLKVLGSPFRIEILYKIGNGEACVCHLEEALKKRQAYISQHLMVLRDAGILDTRRDGKFIYYRVADARVFELIESAAKLLKIPSENIPKISDTDRYENCACPSCDPEIQPEYVSK